MFLVFESGPILTTTVIEVRPDPRRLAELRAMEKRRTEQQIWVQALRAMPKC